MRTTQKDIEIINFVAYRANLTLATCSVIKSLARLLKYTAAETEGLVEAWRQSSNANEKTIGFRDKQDANAFENIFYLASLRKERLQAFVLQLRNGVSETPYEKARVVRSAETDSKLVSFLSNCADLTLPTCPLLVDIARLAGYDKEDTDDLITSWRDFSKADGMFPGFHDMPDWTTLSADDKVLIRIHKLDDFRNYLNKDFKQ